MTHPRLTRSLNLPILVVLAAAFGCRDKTPAPEPDSLNQPAAQAPAAVVSGNAATAVSASNAANSPTSLENASAANAQTAASAGSTTSATSAQTAAPATAKAPPVPERGGTTTGTPGDPLDGKFTLEDATKGLPKTGKLVAEMVTDAGTLKCEMFEDKAPNTVANFVGLARGLRPFKDPKTGTWVKRPGYDDGVFHRIIKGFMIQGGDPLGTGAGDGGYVIADEVWPGASHDRRGLICMANRGKNTNSMQFFIMDGAAKHLDSGYTIFGQCGPDSVIEKLAATEVQGDRAVKPPKIKKVTVKRIK